MVKNIEFSINLCTEGDNFFDVLKAFIRDSKKSQWPHEKGRAEYAADLFYRALQNYEKGIIAAENKIQEGFQTEQDQLMLKKMKEKCDYWKKKYDEVVGKKTTSCCCE